MATDYPTIVYGDRIVTHPDVLAGKPTVKGTRISVELVLRYLARMPDLSQLFADDSEMIIEDVKACLAYAAALVAGEAVIPASHTENDPPRVRLADPNDPWKDYDPEKVLQALHEAAGLLKGVDTEQLKRDLREQRGQDSTGRPADT
jgi:uncharacterized protein (DUF433 family)